MPKTKIKYLVADDYMIVGNTGGPSDVLSPGDRLAYDEDLASHKQIAREVAAGASNGLRLIEVDPEQEKAAEAEKAEQLEEAEQIAAKQRQEEADAERERLEAAASGFNPEEHNVAEVVDHLKASSSDEVARVKELEAASSRDSKQVADFKPSD